MQFLSELKKQNNEYDIYKDGSEFGAMKNKFAKRFDNKLIDSLNPFLLYNDPENKLEDYSKDGAGYGFDRFQRVTNAIVLACAAVAALLAIGYLIPVMGPVAFGMGAGSAQAMTAGITTAIVGLGGVATFAAVPGAVKGLSDLATNTQPNVDKLTKELSKHIHNEVEQTVDAIKHRKLNGISTTGKELDQLNSDIATTINNKYGDKLGEKRTEALIKQLQDVATKDYGDFVVSKNIDDTSMTPEIKTDVEKTLGDHVLDANKLIKETKMDMAEAREIAHKMNTKASEPGLLVANPNKSGGIEIEFVSSSTSTNKANEPVKMNCRPDNKDQQNHADKARGRSSNNHAQNPGFGGFGGR